MWCSYGGVLLSSCEGIPVFLNPANKNTRIFIFCSFILIYSISRAWCKTIVTSYIKYLIYNSFAPSPRYMFVRMCAHAFKYFCMCLIVCTLVWDIPVYWTNVCFPIVCRMQLFMAWTMSNRIWSGMMIQTIWLYLHS